MARRSMTALLLVLGFASSMAQAITDLEERDGVYFKRSSTEPYAGMAFSYHESGGISEEFRFEHGMLEGAQLFYNEKGKLIKEEHFRNGVAEGDFLEFYSNGRRIKKKGMYRQDKQYGTWAYYDDKGKIIKEEVYSAYGDRISERTF